MCINIDYSNENDLGKFVEDNISLFNDGFTAFKDELAKHEGLNFDITAIKNYLKDKLIEDCKDDSKIKTLLLEFEKKGCAKKAITDLANKHCYYTKDLEAFYQRELYADLFNNVSGDLDKAIADLILESSTVSSSKKKFVSHRLNNIIKKSTVLIKQNGFSNNLNNIESGVQTANAGDSAQFLFISRAILAGYNCSNVDVRSSRYDAVIDYKGIIYRVQVKGISDTTVSFIDRDRGGRGIDSHNERNKGKRITSADCDIYVAVDKQVGICYIIPVKEFVDRLGPKEAKSYSINKLQKYRENWGIVNEMYEKDPRSKFTDYSAEEAITLINKKES